MNAEKIPAIAVGTRPGHTGYLVTIPVWLRERFISIKPDDVVGFIPSTKNTPDVWSINGEVIHETP